MADPDSILPYDRLPEGFARRLDNPPAVPVVPRPAATVLLLRDGEAGPEVLLVKRVRDAGFVPGAYVFPGGRVDPDDADAGVLARTEGLDPEAIRLRLGLQPDASPSAAAFPIAALREAFEETGLLVARRADGSPVLSAHDDPTVETQRAGLLAEEVTFAEALGTLDAQLDAGSLEYVAHWITPVAEPRRYDTRFFAAAIETRGAVSLNPAEMTDAMWITPAEAVERHRAGEVPMIFPTLKTLMSLRDFGGVRSLLASFAAHDIPTIMPRLVRTPEGLGLELEIPEE